MQHNIEIIYTGTALVANAYVDSPVDGTPLIVSATGSTVEAVAAALWQALTAAGIAASGLRFAGELTAR